MIGDLLSNIWKLLKWALGEAWEKINIFETWRELKELGKKYGVRFFIAALIWEIIEDGVFPLLSWWAGVPQLIPLFLIFHFEPVVYPVFFWGFRTWDRFRGEEPWEPDRIAYSSHWRSFVKVTNYRLLAAAPVILLLLFLNINLWYAMAYTLIMGVFSFVHERTWHDSNYGIEVDTDQVEPRRNLAKAATYRMVSLLMVGTFLHALLGTVPWVALLTYQVVMFGIYLASEFIWSQISFGIHYEEGAVVQVKDAKPVDNGMTEFSIQTICGKCGKAKDFTLTF